MLNENHIWNFAFLIRTQNSIDELLWLLSTCWGAFFVGLENGLAGASTYVRLMWKATDFQVCFLLFVRIPQSFASKLMAPKFRSQLCAAFFIGNSICWSFIHILKEWSICPINVIGDAFAYAFCLSFSRRRRTWGPWVPALIYSKHSHGHNMNFEYFIEKVSQKIKVCNAQNCSCSGPTRAHSRSLGSRSRHCQPLFAWPIYIWCSFIKMMSQ